MINLDKQQRLKQLDDTTFALWQHDLAIIKRVVTAIAAFKQPQNVFHDQDEYGIPDYADSADWHRIDPFKTYLSHYDLALDFLYAISILDEIEQYFPLQRFPIYLEVFSDCIYDLEIRDRPYQTRCFEHIMINRLNDCIEQVHREMNRPSNKSELKRVIDKSQRQFKKVNDYIDGLFLRYSRLLAVRLDFGYKENTGTSCEIISDHREKLIRYLREQHIGDAVVGYIWKLEYGLRKGYHLHFMLFMDASKVQQSITHGQIICEHWNTHITQGEGTAYNCNARMNQYKYCGIGRISHDEALKIRHVRSACRYLTKHDEFIELLHYGDQYRQHEEGYSLLIPQDSLPKLRMFGTGQLPPLKPHIGRPRREN